MKDKEETITITMKEYKELLETKGRYEELKSIYQPYYELTTNLSYNGIRPYDNELKPPYKVTCDTESEV